MKFLSCAAVFALIFLTVFAYASENVDTVLDAVDISGIAAAAPEMDVGEMIKSLARGEGDWDLDAVFARAGEILKEELSYALSALAALIAPVVLSAIFRHVAGEGKSSTAVSQVCYLICAVTLIQRMFALGVLAGELIGRIASLSDAVYPVMAALLSLGGAGNTVALMTPVSALAGNIFSQILNGVLLKLCAVASVVVAAGNLSPGIRLEKLLGLIKSVVNWVSGVMMTAFLGIVAMKNLLAAGYDSAAVRTARYAVDNLLPVIGGEVANTMDALVSSVLLVKNAAGVTGILAMIFVCAQPLMRLFAMMLALRLAAAAIEPIADEPLVRLTDGFSQVAGMLLILCAAAAVILTLMLGGTLAAGSGLVR